MLVAGIGGKYSSKTSESTTTPTSNLSASLSAALSSSQHSHKPCEKLPFLTKITAYWLKEQLELPSTTWHRPSGLVTCQNLRLTTVAGSGSFYSINTEATIIVISTPHSKKPSPSPSSVNFTRTSPPQRTSLSPSCALPSSYFPCAPVNTSAPIPQRKGEGQGQGH